MALYGSGITLHTTRVHLNNMTIKGLSAMEKQTVVAAKLLRDANVDLVALLARLEACLKG